jgi:hypothetical protein
MVMDSIFHLHNFPVKQLKSEIKFQFPFLHIFVAGNQLYGIIKNFGNYKLIGIHTKKKQLGEDFVDRRGLHSCEKNSVEVRTIS